MSYMTFNDEGHFYLDLPLLKRLEFKGKEKMKVHA